MSLGGASIDSDAFALGDTTLVGTIWPLNEPENGRYFGIAPCLTLPTGNHSVTRPSLGSNRWSMAIQPGFVFNVAPKWSVDLVGDATIYGDNEDGPGGVTVEKDPGCTALGWVNHHASDTTTLSLSEPRHVGAVPKPSAGSRAPR